MYRVKLIFLADNEYKYIALLRGINVGGHKKVPMADLRELLSGMGYSRVKTLLNSGNVVFSAVSEDQATIASSMAAAIAERFGFEVPTLVLDHQVVQSLIATDPFADTPLHKDHQCYVTFCRQATLSNKLPWQSADGSFRIIAESGRLVMTVLDRSKSGTPEGMKILEKRYGKDITTRNWKTVRKIAAQG